jgi:PAS domain S-box-containing protein
MTQHSAAEILESMSDAFLALDRQWRYTYVNCAAEQFIGLCRGDLLGRTPWELFPEIIGSQFELVCRRAMDERVKGELETYYRPMDRWFFESVYPTADGIAVRVEDITERRRSAEPPGQSEQRLRDYFELGLIGMAITSPTKGILEVNDQICNILGFPRSELLQKSWAELTHPEDVSADEAHFNRVLAGEIEGYALAKRWIRKDGGIVHAAISVKCSRRDDGSIESFTALLQDLSEQNLTRNTLWQRDEQYRTLFNSMDEGFCIIEMMSDSSGNPVDYIFLEANPAFSKDHGFEQSPVGRRALQLCPDLDKSWIDVYGKVALTGQPMRLQSEVKSVGRWFEVHAFRFGGSGSRKVAVLFNDITERTRAEEALRNSHEELERRVDNRTAALTEANVALHEEVRERKRAEEEARRSKVYLAAGQRLTRTGSGAWNVRTGEVFWSEESYRIYGFEPGGAEPSSELFSQILHPDDRSFVWESFDAVVREKREYDIRFRIVHPDGGIRHIHSVGSCVVDESGDLIEVIGTVVDVTEQTLAEEGLRKAQEQLAHATRLAVAGALTTSIAHEINQPLGALVINGDACLRWLGQEPPDPGEARQAVTRMIENAVRASDVMKRIRALGANTAPKLTALKINNVIEDAIALAASELKKRQVVLQMELQPEVPLVLGDRIQLQQAILILILNGDRTASHVSRPVRELIIRSQPGEPHGVKVSVQDSCATLSPPDTERIFDPLFSIKEGGSGLELSIIHTIIERHGGRVWATQNGGRGATFHISLPAAE